MDDDCENTSWQADAHGIESGIASALFFLVPPTLAFAFRRLPEWRDLWLPTLLAVPVVVVASVLFSGIGDGAAVRAASITWFIWLGLLAWRLLRLADGSTVRPAGETVDWTALVRFGGRPAQETSRTLRARLTSPGATRADRVAAFIATDRVRTLLPNEGRMTRWED